MSLLPTYILKILGIISYFFWSAVFLQWDIECGQFSYKVVLLGILWILLSMGGIATLQWKCVTPSNSSNAQKKQTRYIILSGMGNTSYLMFNLALMVYFSNRSTEMKCPELSVDYTLVSALFMVSMCALFLELLQVAIILVNDQNQDNQKTENAV